MRPTILVLLIGTVFGLLTGCQAMMAPSLKKFAAYQSWVGQKSVLLEKVLGKPTEIKDSLEGRYRTYRYIGEFRSTNQQIFIGKVDPNRMVSTSYTVFNMPGGNICTSEFLINSENVVVDWKSIGNASCGGVPVVPGADLTGYEMKSKEILDLPVGDKYVLPSALEDLFANRVLIGHYRNILPLLTFRRYYYDDGRIIEVSKQYGEKHGRWRISSEGVCEQFIGEALVCLRLKKDWILGGAGRLIGYRMLKKKGMRSVYIEFNAFVDQPPVPWN